MQFKKDRYQAKRAARIARGEKVSTEESGSSSDKTPEEPEEEDIPNYEMYVHTNTKDLAVVLARLVRGHSCPMSCGVLESRAAFAQRCCPG